MTKLRLNLAIIAVVLGVIGAVATKAATMHKISDQLYDWTHYDTDGTTILGHDNGLSLSDAETMYGCSTPPATKCAVGTASGQPNVEIYYQP
ncbi:MAG: hypothetical protein JSU01_02455 [Bacteroidetes bacterium]|nr:hypothetical protein [Bacteroidota bacterium]